MSYLQPFNPEQMKEKIAEVLALLRTRGALKPCPRCGQFNWQADLLGFLVSALPVVILNVPPAHTPVLMLTCKHCGNMQLHNLNILGISVPAPGSLG
jgi:hypothetical protein